MARTASCRFSSQAIMCVQLLSWCVAACLLLYRGVTTLRREPPVLVPSRGGLGNDTVFTNDTSTPDVNAPGASPIVTPNHLPPLTLDKPRGAAAEPASPAKGKEASVLYVYSHMNIPAAAQGAGSWQQRVEAEPVTGVEAAVEETVEEKNRTEKGADGHRRGGKFTFSRLRYELRPASLILIVLGFSMLLVGPVVVVLRKCDSTLLHRRVTKLPTDEEAVYDPPPSYDEATLGSSGAPRYSTLFEVCDSGELVCLNAPAPAPPPEPAEAAPPAPDDTKAASTTCAHGAGRKK